jgi:hypothetical protein
MTRLLIVGSADDIDVTVGLRQLLEKKNIAEIVLPLVSQMKHKTKSSLLPLKKVSLLAQVKS